MNQILFVLLFVLFERIIARGPPVLLKQTPNLILVEINENEPLELRCPVTITRDLSFQWSKNSEELDSMWSTSNLLIKGFLLKIHRIHRSDSGLYKCNAVNGFGSVQAQFKVNVKSNETSSNGIVDVAEQQMIVWDVKSFHGEAPKFLSRSNQNDIESTKIIQPEGTTVQLKCLASGKPEPLTRWKKNGKILSEDEYGITQSQVLNIKDLRQSDAGNYTCEVFNSFGTINATYNLIVTESLQFFGNDPQNITVDIGKEAKLDCRIQTRDITTKIYWLKKLVKQQLFRSDLMIFGSDEFETIEQSIKEEYSNSILSKPLIFPQIRLQDSGEYICLIHNEKGTNYKRAYINVISADKGSTILIHNQNFLLYVTLIPLLILGVVLIFIFWCSCYQQQNISHNHNSSYTASFKSSMKTRQPLVHHNDVMFPAARSHTSNDYLTDNIDSIPVHRQYQQQRYGPSSASDHASLASSNPYYTRVQAI